MGMIAAAVLPSLIQVGGSLIAGSSSGSAANDQANAASGGIDLLNNEFNQTRSDLMPWMTAGQSALGGLSGLLGLGGAGSQQSAIDALQGGPMFQSLFRQGTNAVEGAASATGGLRGGNVNGSLFNVGQDALAQTIQQQIANLMGVSGQGLGAAGSVGQFGAANAENVAALMGQRGAAQAGGAMANGNMWGNILGTAGGLFTGGGPLSGIFGGAGNGGTTIASGFNPLGDPSSWDPISASVGF